MAKKWTAHFFTSFAEHMLPLLYDGIMAKILHLSYAIKIKGLPNEAIF